MDEVQAIITLRSGKEIEQPMSKPVGKTREQEEEEPEQIIIKEDSMKESMHPPPSLNKGFNGRKCKCCGPK